MRSTETRTLWIIAAFSLLALFGIAYAREWVTGCDTLQPGATLHLVRSDVDTVRARFSYSLDCRLIAEQMNKVERARWLGWQQIKARLEQHPHLD